MLVELATPDDLPKPDEQAAERCPILDCSPAPQPSSFQLWTCGDIHQVQFDAAGERLFCVTEKGARVFSWEELLAANRQVPAPVAAAEAESVPIEHGSMSYTYTLAHDADRDRLLFAGLEGRLRCLALETGQSATVLEIPGRPAILSMGLSQAGSAICCHCQPDFPTTGRQAQPPLIPIWDYAKLLS